MLADPNSVPKSIFKDMPLISLNSSGPTCQCDTTAGPPPLGVDSPAGQCAHYSSRTDPACSLPFENLWDGCGGSWILVKNCLPAASSGFPETCQTRGSLRVGGCGGVSLQSPGPVAPIMGHQLSSFCCFRALCLVSVWKLVLANQALLCRIHFHSVWLS